MAVEAAIQIAGLWTGMPDRVRLWAVTWAGFWPGLLGDWQPNFPLQPLAMFATYWIVHAGLAHLFGNVAAVLWFSWRIGPDLRPMQTLEIWLGSVLGGAITFGFLSESISPMIGASGGVFGLCGAFVILDHYERRQMSGARAAIFRTALICTAILVLSQIDLALRDAVLAWQAHLGGFIVGALLTFLIVPANDVRQT